MRLIRKIYTFLRKSKTFTTFHFQFANSPDSFFMNWSFGSFTFNFISWDRVSRLFSVIFLPLFVILLASSLPHHTIACAQHKRRRKRENSMKNFHSCAAQLVKMWQLFSSIHPVKMWALRWQTLIVVILGLTVDLTTASHLSGNIRNLFN